jgi:response regulator NasT
MSPAHSKSASLRIAVAEDEAEIRQFLKECLSRAGHAVIEAGGGEQLVSMCQSHRPDLIVADIRMPGLDGLKAAATINRDGPPIPVVIVTSHPQDDIHADEADYDGLPVQAGQAGRPAGVGGAGDAPAPAVSPGGG